MSKNFKKGFTLLEILLVVGIISLLAGIVIVAINPSKQLATVRNTQRQSDIKQLNSAITQYYIDTGRYPSTILGTLTEICDTGTATTSTTCGSLVNLTALVPTYITAIPKDPQGPITLNPLINTAHAATNGTGYYVMKDTTNKLVVASERAELNAIIAIGTSTDLFGGIVIDACGTSGDATDPDCWSTNNDVGNGHVVWGPMNNVIGTSADTDGSVSQATWFNAVGNSSSYPAFYACYNHVENGYSDWYLPSIQQLNYALNAEVTGFQGDYYWASTEDSGNPGNEAWNLDMYEITNIQSLNTKDSNGAVVRCLR